MRLEPPSWWYQPNVTTIARLLEPAGSIVAAAARRRFEQAKPYRSSVPVICIGNLTAGGAGKTPLAICIGTLLSAARRNPGFLTRGYGGTEPGPRIVDLGRDNAMTVGDEALLLARRAGTVVARDRAAGARALEAMGVDIIVMDDGLQNPGLAKQLSIAVLDPRRLIGNGLVMPAGPLRADLQSQLRRTDALVVLCGQGEPMPGLPPALRSFPGPVLRAELCADPKTAAAMKGKELIAYAGIGRPSKLFDTLRGLDAKIAVELPFPDHHRYTEDEAEHLLALADAHKAMLATTEKDLARLPSDGRLGDLRKASTALPVSAQFSGRDFDRLVSMLELLLIR